MSPTIACRGVLRHRFWGDYSAVVAIEPLGTPSERRAWCQQLRHQIPVVDGCAVQVIHDGDRSGVQVLLEGDAVETVSAWIEERRTDGPCPRRECKGKRHSIGSLAHSIDYGPAFDLELPILDLITPPLPFPS